MSKFRLKMKLQGFELEIEGTRDDVPQIAQSLSRQIGGMFEPAAQIITGDASEISEAEQISAPEALPAPAKRKRSPKKRTATASTSAGADSDALDWRHDSSKWGMPQQSWKTAAKSIWLLYVAREATNEREMSAARIASTFNKHFRQANRVMPNNVSRDLGKQKLKTPAPVGEDTSKDPPQWFLTDEGVRQARALIADAQSHEA
jgi:hypothetical protein